MDAMPSLHEDIKSLIRTRHAIVTVDTLDEGFAARTITEAVSEMGLPVLEWTVSGGLRGAGVPALERGLTGTDKLSGALQHLRHSELIGVYVFKDALR